MGLDKTKGLLFKSDFSHDRLSVDNLLYNEVNRTSIPFKENDVIIDKHLTVFYSVDYILHRLLDNDKFIEQYIEKTKNVLSGISRDKFIEAFELNYQINDSDISSIYTDKLSEHNNNYHSSSAVEMSVISENYMKTDMSNIDISAAKNGNFLKLSSDESASILTCSINEVYDASLQNDIITKIEFDSDVAKPNNYVNIAICNENTGNVFRLHITKVADITTTYPGTDETKYIYKEWMSGVKEFYIYVPTTFTFYHENDDLADIDVHNNSTFIRLKINKRHFSLNHIYLAHICPQSLPLLIHNELNLHYSDVILPSILRTMCISNDKYDNVECSFEENTSRYVLYFSCYGSDAQAIHIIGN